LTTISSLRCSSCLRAACENRQSEVDHLDVVAQDRSRDRKRGALRSIGGAPVVEVTLSNPARPVKSEFWNTSEASS